MSPGETGHPEESAALSPIPPTRFSNPEAILQPVEGNEQRPRIGKGL